jgi:hypothetical protein
VSLPRAYGSTARQTMTNAEEVDVDLPARARPRNSTALRNAEAGVVDEDGRCAPPLEDPGDRASTAASPSRPPCGGGRLPSR